MNTENKTNVTFFASQIPQEFATKLVSVADSCTGVKTAFSLIGCRFGYIGFYAEFDNNEEKRMFLDKIKGTYEKSMVWAS